MKYALLIYSGSRVPEAEIADPVGWIEYTRAGWPGGLARFAT